MHWFYQCLLYCIMCFRLWIWFLFEKNHSWFSLKCFVWQREIPHNIFPMFLYYLFNNVLNCLFFRHNTWPCTCHVYMFILWLPGQKLSVITVWVVKFLSQCPQAWKHWYNWLNGICITEINLKSRYITRKLCPFLSVQKYSSLLHKKFTFVITRLHSSLHQCAHSLSRAHAQTESK